jgi:hypothetical protein
MRIVRLAMLLMLSGCQCGVNSGAPKSLVIAPVDATFTTDGIIPAGSAYSVKAVFHDGRTEDVTSQITFDLKDRRIGAFQDNLFQSSIRQGGKSEIEVSFEGLKVSTSITVVLNRVILDSRSTNLPSSPQDRFVKAPVSGRSPDMVYPNNGALIPANLGRLEIHFMPGAGNTLFQLSMQSQYSAVTVYLRCGTPVNGGCIYLPDATVWGALVSSNRGGAPVQLTLKGTDDTGTAVGESNPLSLSFSQDDVLGGLYYWSTTNKAIMRFNFASATQTSAEKYIDGAVIGRPNGCIGCHALSRDGKKMVVESEGSLDGDIAIVDVATKQLTTPFPARNKSFFSSWNPDSTKFVGVNDRGSDFNLRILDGTTGALIESLTGTGDSTRPADHPDWSADGNTIAYASVTREGPRAVSLQWPTKGAIRMVQKTGTTWSAPVEIAPFQPQKNRYYPAIAPNNEYLVYNESSCNSGSEADINCDGDTDPDAKLFAAKLSANAARVELKNANAPGKEDRGETKLSNSFPKWSPFTFQRTTDPSSKVQWLTFSSTRAYGLRRPNAQTWLWMVAIDPEKIARGEDGSSPAFCLPFQDLTTSNHIAQWAAEVVGDIN